MSKPQRPVLQFTIGDYLRSWRDMAGLSQTQMADLSRELYEQETIDRAYTQGLISRMEKGQHPDMRDDNMRAICTLLAVALQNAGHEEAIADDLMRALRSIKRKRVDPKDLDENVLHFNVLLQGYPMHTRRIFWKAAEALLMAIDEQYKEEIATIRRRITEKREMRRDSETDV